MDEVFQCVAPTLCIDSGKHAVASSKSSWVFLENKKMNPVMAASCPYSIFDHVMEMLKSGIKLNSSHYFCRGCKKTKRKSIIPKCSICKTDVKMCQAWLVAALSGGFQDLYSGLSSEISSTKDHRSQQKSWLNHLLGKLLGFLTEGKPYSHGDHWPIKGPARDYLDSVYSLSQDDIKKLTPITLSRDDSKEGKNYYNTSLTSNCDSRNVNNNKNPSISEHFESRMDSDLIITASGSDLDLDILQRSPDVSAGTTDTSVDRGSKRPGVTDPERESLVNTMRRMAANIKELQDESLETKKSFKYQIQKLEREIVTLKRKRCDSCTNTNAKQPKLSFREPAAKADLVKEGEENAVEYWQDEFDNTEEGIFESELAPRGINTHDLPEKYLNLEYFANWKGSGAEKPLCSKKMEPKLRKMGLKRTTVSSLSMGQKMELMCLIARLLYDTKAQPRGIPSWVPKCYLNPGLTSSLIMEKIMVVTPQGFFTILRNLEFFKVDRLGVMECFYEEQDIPPTGEDSATIISLARNKYADYRFSQDLRDRIGRAGTVGDIHVEPRNLPLPVDVPMEVEPDSQEQDLRSKITGKPVPGTSSRIDASKVAFASGDVRFKSAEELAHNKQMSEAWDQKMKEKYRKKRIRDKLEKYEKKLPTQRSGARKASADRSPERRGRKRYRSSSFFTSSSESVSPRRTSRSSRQPSSQSPSPTRGRRETVRSAKGKSGRLSYSRSASPRRSRRPASPPRSTRRSPSISPRRRRDSGRSSRRDYDHIPGMSSHVTAPISTLTGREFSPARSKSSRKPAHRSSRTPTPARRSRDSPEWEVATSRRRRKAHR